MPTPSYTVRCLRKKLVAPGVYEVAFEKPKGFTFRAGQFVLFDVPLVNNPADIQARAYSIASTPDEGDLLFIVKLKEGGRFSTWLEEKIAAGSQVNIKGPFGLFTLRPGDGDALFVATGAGLAPFRSQILDALKNGEKRTMHLFFGVRSEKDLFRHEEFQSLAASHPNFKLHLCLSGENPAWAGNKGRVQQFIPAVIREKETTQIYVCGAPAMVSDIKKLALETWGMPKANVHAEGYI